MMDRWHPFGVATVMVLAAFLSLRLTDAIADETWDAWILVLAFTATLLVWVFMLIRTRWDRWSWLGTGLFFQTLGVNALYGHLLATGMDIVVRSPMWLELARSAVAVGSAAVLYGLWRRRVHAKQGGDV